MVDKNISGQTLRRLPVYLHYLTSIRGQQKNISATAISEAFGLNDVQVRKDLGAVSGSGRPKTGYVVEELIGQIQQCLGCGENNRAVLVGTGNLGKALISYGGFADYGLDIVAAFDRDPGIAGTVISHRTVRPMGDLEKVCREKDVQLGIITVPASGAQEICDRLVSCGIRAVWNFAPTILRAPEGVIVENENLASSLAVLSKHLQAGDGSERNGEK